MRKRGKKKRDKEVEQKVSGLRVKVKRSSTGDLLAILSQANMVKWTGDKKNPLTSSSGQLPGLTPAIPESPSSADNLNLRERRKRERKEKEASVRARAEASRRARLERKRKEQERLKAEAERKRRRNMEQKKRRAHMLDTDRRNSDRLRRLSKKSLDQLAKVSD